MFAKTERLSDFTIKELIVVIKIIIILSGRLLPTLQSARDKARMYYYINYANAIPILQLEYRRLIIFYICKNNIVSMFSDLIVKSA